MKDMKIPFALDLFELLLFSSKRHTFKDSTSVANKLWLTEKNPAAWVIINPAADFDISKTTVV